MKIYNEKKKLPILLIHGGTGLGAIPAEITKKRQAILRHVIADSWKGLSAGGSALDAVSRAVELLEADPNFNAGRGGVLQSDGQARLSCSMMDGSIEKFSGVALVTNLIHPSKLARALQERSDTVLGPYGAQLLARELGIPCENPATVEQLEKLVEFHRERLKAPGGPDELPHGTVGAVALDSKGRLAACTSTGGFSTNFPERMSDSSTVAGNFATQFAAISCTGMGEQIMNHGTAVRLETRVRDGKTIGQASELVLKEAKAANGNFAWIGLDRHGNWSIARSTKIIYACGIAAEDAEPFLADAA